MHAGASIMEMSTERVTRPAAQQTAVGMYAARVADVEAN
jgi:hypothetical protein